MRTRWLWTGILVWLSTSAWAQGPAGSTPLLMPLASASDGLLEQNASHNPLIAGEAPPDDLLANESPVETLIPFWSRAIEHKIRDLAQSPVVLIGPTAQEPWSPIALESQEHLLPNHSKSTLDAPRPAVFLGAF